MKRALVFGGTGAVGREVVRALAAEGVGCAFTYHQQREVAEALAREVDGRAMMLDATDGAAVASVFRESPPLDVFIHCAGSLNTASLADVTDSALDHALALQVRSSLIACRELAPSMMARGSGDVLLVGGLDRAQSLPVPITYAAAHGAVGAMTMALAKELAPHGIRVNMVALGLLETGLSRDLSDDLREDFVAFSALRRLGTTVEVAQAIAWLALHNRYLNGKVIPLNGGL